MHASLAVLSATNLLYHFPGLLTVMSKAAYGEIEVPQTITAATFRHLVFSPDVIAHSVHFTLASIAVTGVFLTWIAGRGLEAAPFRLLGARIALAATLAQIPSGVALLVLTPTIAQTRLLGADSFALGLFIGSMVSVFFLLQDLSMLAFGDAPPGTTSRCRWILILTVLLMTGALRMSRG
jgi:hypothetical protein